MERETTGAPALPQRAAPHWGGDGHLNDYHARVAQAVSERGLQAALPGLKRSEKYLPSGAPAPFPGFTLMTPPGVQDPLQNELYRRLSALQRSLVRDLGEKRLSLLPPESFHLTVADLFAAEGAQRAGRKLVASSTAEESHSSEELFLGEALLGRCLLSWFQRKTPELLSALPWRWEVAGLALFEHALVLLFVPSGKEDYRLLTELRETIYRSPELASLGLRAPRPLMAHITLAYYQSLPPLEERLLSWVKKISATKQSLQGSLFQLERVRLCRFSSMEDYQVIPFGGG